jgi:hypothetical protein
MSAICRFTLENPSSGAPTSFDPAGSLNVQPDDTVTLTINETTKEVLSVQPDGTWQTRPAGTAGPYERAGLNGNTLAYCPIGKAIYGYLFFKSVPNV